MKKSTGLKPETVKPFAVRLTFGDGELLRKECHFCMFSETCVDLYKVRDGELIKFAAYGNVVRVEED